MKIDSRSVLLLVALSAMFLSQRARADVINFDDLSGGGPLAANYAGLTWTNWGFFDDVQSDYNPSSGAERIYVITPSHVGDIQFGNAVTLNSFWAAGYNMGQVVEGYSNGNLVFSTILPGDGTGFGSTLTLGWAGIDELKFQGENFWALDDLNYTPGGSVPDSGATLAMLGGAFFALAAFCRRFVA